jgi:hypothetical protein
VDTGTTDRDTIRLAMARMVMEISKKMPAFQEKAIGRRSVRVRGQLRKAEFQASSFGGGFMGVEA